MLPVSGAEQLNTSGAQCTRPMISHSGAYSRLDERAAVRFRQEQVPQARGARLGLQLLDDRHRLPALARSHVGVPLVLVRIDVLVHEGHELLAAAPAPSACTRSSCCSPSVIFSTCCQPSSAIGSRPLAGVARVLGSPRCRRPRAWRCPAGWRRCGTCCRRCRSPSATGSIAALPGRFAVARSRTRSPSGCRAPRGRARRCRGTGRAGCASSCSGRRSRRADGRASESSQSSTARMRGSVGWKIMLSRR